MPFLARKINRVKCDPQPGIAPDEIPSDAVTADLRTTGNALSLWRCAEADETSLRRVVLAFAAGFDKPNRLDLV